MTAHERRLLKKRKGIHVNTAVSLAVCCALAVSAAQALTKEGFESGIGTKEHPWMIADAAQLDRLRFFLGPIHSNAWFALANDVDLTAYLAPGGDGYAKWGTAGWAPIGYPQEWPDRSKAFFGKLNGNGHRVAGLWISRDATGVGLFGCTEEGCEILNLEVVSDAAQGGVRGDGETGGVVGAAFGSLLANASMRGLVRGSSSVGGLVGMVEVTVLSNCHAECTVALDSWYGGAGGLVGGLHNGLVVSSYANCRVSGSYGVGGLVGHVNTYGTLSNCYAKGRVTASDRVGGVAGSNFGVISHVYSACAVSGDTHVGGLAGENATREIACSHFDVLAAGITNGVGGSGVLGGGYGKTAEEMRRQATFAGWDFDAVWSIREGLACPVFRWQPYSPVSIKVAGFTTVEGALAFTWSDVGTNVPVVCGKTRLSDAEWTPLASGDGVTVHVHGVGATLVLDAQNGAPPYRFFTVLVP